MAAFEAAAAAGYAIELDVRASIDGVAVVVHDPDLRRVADVDLVVAQTAWERLRSVPLGGTTQLVPRLDDVLDLVEGRVPVMVEIKNHGPRPGPLESAVAQALSGRAGQPLCVASFNPATVAWFARAHPQVVRGQTAGPLADVSVPRWVRAGSRSMLGNVAARPHFLSYDLQGLPSRPVQWWRRGGRPLITWTARTDADLSRAAALADQVIFERVRPPLP